MKPKPKPEPYRWVQPHEYSHRCAICGQGSWVIAAEGDKLCRDDYDRRKLQRRGLLPWDNGARRTE